MKMKIQKQVAEFVNANRLETTAAYHLLDLVSEIGEVSKEVLKSTQYGKREFRNGENWEQELGDVFFSLICVANSSGVDLEVALSKALSKYQDSIRKTGDAGSGE